MTQQPESSPFMMRCGVSTLSRDHEYIDWHPTDADRDQAIKNHRQTLEHLKQRGGVSWSEMAAILERREWREMDQGAARNAVFAELSRRSNGDPTAQQPEPPLSARLESHAASWGGPAAVILREAAEHIARIERERDDALIAKDIVVREAHNNGMAAAKSWKFASEQEEVVASLRAQLERLRGALEPFAKCADELDATEDTPRAPDGEWAKFRLLTDDYRRARAALTQQDAKAE